MVAAIRKRYPFQISKPIYFDDVLKIQYRIIKEKLFFVIDDYIILLYNDDYKIFLAKKQIVALEMKLKYF